MYVSRLRKSFASAPAVRIETTPPGYRLTLEGGTLDVAEFEQLAGSGRELLGASAPAAADALHEALALWRGEALSEFAYDEWAIPERRRLEDLRMAVIEDRIDVDLRLGRHAQLVGELEVLVGREPLRERLQAQLILALYRSGRQAHALAACQKARAELVDRLGIDPSRELADLERAILNHDRALDAPSVTNTGVRPDVVGEEVEPGAAAGEQPAAAEVMPTVDACVLCGYGNFPGAEVCASCRTVLRGDDRRKERKPVTVMCLSATDVPPADPEQAEQALAAVRAVARREVVRFGGICDAGSLDAVLAFFGAPSAHEDDPERAVRASLAIRAALGDTPVAQLARMAIASGPAVVNRDPDPAAGEQLVAGGPLGSVRDMHAAAAAGAIVVCDRTRRATRRVIDYERASSPKAACWEALSARARVGADRGDHTATSLIGREHELGMLISALERTCKRQTVQLVTVVGAPGLGKSRLVWELYRWADAQPELVTWCGGGCRSFAGGGVFAPLAEAVASNAGVLASDTADQAAAKLGDVVERNLPDDDDRAWVRRHLDALLGVADTESDVERGDRGGAWRYYLRAIAERRPLVVVFEDLQWADDGLIDFIEELLEWAVGVSMLVVCTARPELFDRRPRWAGGNSNTATVTLDPLSDADVDALFDELLGPGSADGRHSLLGWAAGNPLYAREYALMLTDPGGDARGAPESVEALIAARIDALSDDDRGCLQDAAVVGDTAWVGAIAAVSGRPVADVTDSVLRLERRGLVRRAKRPSVESELELCFDHALVREVAYERIPLARRTQRHARVAGWLTAVTQGREEHAGLIADHLAAAYTYAPAGGGERAALEPQVREALYRVGLYTLRLGTFPPAVDYCARALELWPVPDPRRPLVELAHGQARSNAFEDGAEQLTRARDALLAIGDAQSAGEAETALAWESWGKGRFTEAAMHIEGAVDLLEAAEPSRERVAALALAAMIAASGSGNVERAQVLATQALDTADRLGLPYAQAQARHALGQARFIAGDPEAVTLIEQALDQARAAGFSGTGMCGDLAEFHRQCGNLEAAARNHADHQNAARRTGDRIRLRWSLADDVAFDYYAGRFDDAVEAGGAVPRRRPAGRPRRARVRVPRLSGPDRCPARRHCCRRGTRPRRSCPRGRSAQLAERVLGGELRLPRRGTGAHRPPTAGPMLRSLLGRLGPVEAFGLAGRLPDVVAATLALGASGALSDALRALPRPLCGIKPPAHALTVITPARPPNTNRSGRGPTRRLHISPPPGPRCQTVESHANTSNSRARSPSAQLRLHYSKQPRRSWPPSESSRWCGSSCLPDSRVRKRVAVHVKGWMSQYGDLESLACAFVIYGDDEVTVVGAPHKPYVTPPLARTQLAQSAVPAAPVAAEAASVMIMLGSWRLGKTRNVRRRPCMSLNGR